MKKMENQRAVLLWRIYLKITFIVLLYWSVSITMVFLNKKVLSQVDAPFFITWFQCLITVILLALFRAIADMFGLDNDDNRQQDLTKFKIKSDDLINSESSSTTTTSALEIIRKQLLLPTSRIRMLKIRKIMPLSVIFVAMISFNNLSLQYVSVAFYFIVRSLTPVFNLLFTYTILHRKTSWQAIVCCFGIIFGFALGVDQEKAIGTLSFAGVICGLLSSMFVSLNAIYVVDMLKVVDQNVCQLSYYNSLCALVLFIPFIIINGELSNVFNLTFDTSSNNSIMNFWLFMLLSGVFGLLISIVTNLQIKHTSPLTHNISGTAKACTQTVLATYIYEQTKTLNWWLSNMMVLFWSAAYTVVKQQELKKQIILPTIKSTNEQQQSLLNDTDDVDDNLNQLQFNKLHNPQSSINIDNNQYVKMDAVR